MRTLIETATLIRQRKLSASEAVVEALAAIERHNPSLTAFVHVDPEGALAAAGQIDTALADGEDVGPLAGVPFGIKDMEDCLGMPTRRGSLLHADSGPVQSDSIHVGRLCAAGAIPVGKTATAEFGLNSATSTKIAGVTRNPWNLEKTPGGSSGGSSAAVAAGIVPFATGTDAGGSIREPAAFTGLVGLKPSHGRIPKKGGFSNWSVHGIMSATVADTASYLDCVAGPDDRDRQSLPAPGYSFAEASESLDIGGLRAVFSPDHGYAVVEPEVVDLAYKAAQALSKAARLTLSEEPVKIANAYVHMFIVGFADLHKQFQRTGVLPHKRDLLSDQVLHLLERFEEQQHMIDPVMSWDVIYQVERDVASLFRSYDLLISPATACAPYGADSRIPDIIDGRDATRTGVEPFGMIANICWNPSISLPAGLTSDGLPVGIQITARRHRDDILLRLGRLYEQACPWPRPWDAIAARG